MAYLDSNFITVNGLKVFVQTNDFSSLKFLHLSNYMGYKDGNKISFPDLLIILVSKSRKIDSYSTSSSITKDFIRLEADPFQKIQTILSTKYPTACKTDIILVSNRFVHFY